MNLTVIFGLSCCFVLAVGSLLTNIFDNKDDDNETPKGKSNRCFFIIDSY